MYCCCFFVVFIGHWFTPNGSRPCNYFGVSDDLVLAGSTCTGVKEKKPLAYTARVQRLLIPGDPAGYLVSGFWVRSLLSCSRNASGGAPRGGGGA